MKTFIIFFTPVSEVCFTYVFMFQMKTFVICFTSVSEVCFTCVFQVGRLIRFVWFWWSWEWEPLFDDPSNWQIEFNIHRHPLLWISFKYFKLILVIGKLSLTYTNIHVFFSLTYTNQHPLLWNISWFKTKTSVDFGKLCKTLGRLKGIRWVKARYYSPLPSGSVFFNLPLLQINTRHNKCTSCLGSW